VNNPSLRLSANQVIGYVTIKSEEESNLIEASSRERLKENSYYS
jgi:ATP-binding region ATPase domain protein